MNSKQLIPTLDLRGLTKPASLTIVKLFPSSWNETQAFDWILAGEVNLNLNRRDASLDCRLDRCRDREHSAAFAFDLPLIGVTVKGVGRGIVTFEAWVDPNHEHAFYVPSPGWDPRKDAKPCPDRGCEEEPHFITDFLPPPNPELYQKVKGKKVEISIGPVFDWRLP